MTRDRLGSLKAAQKDDGDSDDDGVAAEAWDCKMERFFGEVEGIRADMENIRRVMAEVGVKQSVILSEPRCEERVKVRLVCASIRLTPYRSNLEELLCSTVVCTRERLNFLFFFSLFNINHQS